MKASLRTIRWLAGAALLATMGCFKLSRESPRLQQFILSGVASGSAESPAGGEAAGNSRATPVKLVLGLRRLNLASYLSVPAIIVRRGDNELIVSEFHRWGEAPDEGINRVVAAYLRALPSVLAVEVAPWAARARHDYLLQLHVTRFEGVVDSAGAVGQIHVRASWDVIRPLDGAVLVRGFTEDRGGAWRAGDYAGLVRELDAALARLARDISACLRRFPNDSTPPTRCA